MPEETVFVRCQNCGKIVTAKDAFAQWFCSRNCASIFDCCPVCGKYFEKGKGSGIYCSPACAAPIPEDYRNIKWRQS